MAEPFLGEIRQMSFTFPPKGWALCNGQLLPINQNQALFSLLGTMYGGDGRVTFALPDLRGRVPIHADGGHPQGAAGGQGSVTLTVQQLPSHAHAISASASQASTGVPGPGVMLGTSTGTAAYGPPQNLAPMAPGSLASVGGSQAHENLQPYLTLSFCIAVQGIFPSRN